MKDPFRTRGPAGTLITRVWRALRRRAATIWMLCAELVGHSQDVIHRAVLLLVARGKARKIADVYRVGHKGVRAIYMAVGQTPPRDLRGTRAGSRNHFGTRAYKSWLRMMRVKRGDPRWMPTPKPATALEAAWGMRA